MHRSNGRSNGRETTGGNGQRSMAAPAPRESSSYYELPVIKEPAWTWEVPAYFYVGGVAGGAAVLAAVTQALDGDSTSSLVRNGRWVSTAFSALSASLLISDLGRPARFLNMLRVFKTSSPMSVGSWTLAAAGSLAAAATILGSSSGTLRRLGDLAGLGAGAAGLPLSGYTAVLLSDTAVPVWRHTQRTTPPLFVASAAASTADVLSVTRLDRRDQSIVRRFGLAAHTAELLLAEVLQRDAERSGERIARPFKEGLAGSLWKASKWFGLTSFAIGALAGKTRVGTWASAGLSIAGALATRYAVVRAGYASARDPRATFEKQREQPAWPD
jgi:formate-dependent nitrite reductase membrane component NrfD